MTSTSSTSFTFPPSFKEKDHPLKKKWGGRRGAAVQQVEMEVSMARYEIGDDGGWREVVELDDDEDIEEYLEDVLRDGEYGDRSESIVVTGYYVRVYGDDECGGGWDGSVTVTIPAEEPVCPAGDHLWARPVQIVGGLDSNPGVQGHGGGIIAVGVCLLCGCSRTFDSWADDGHGGHFEKESYEEGAYDVGAALDDDDHPVWEDHPTKDYRIHALVYEGQPYTWDGESLDRAPEGTIVGNFVVDEDGDWVELEDDNE